jgi:pimeloyl-ACP methyl ester carboxylesterase
MPFVELPDSPLAQGPTRVFYREYGAGADALVILHGGWGYDVYPFDRVVEALAADFRIIAPDRTGYGQSGRLARMPPNFHDRAAEETFQLLAHLDLDDPILWGHSDGAVIGAKMGLARPASIRGLILEALHLRRQKPSSREFFETMAESPDALDERVRDVLAREHGEDYWHTLLRMNGLAWLEIAADPSPDLFGGRLKDLHVPTLVIHGRRDPRTEPGELDEIQQALQQTADVAILEEGGHSPHTGRAAAEPAIAAAKRFFETLAARKPPVRA